MAKGTAFDEETLTVGVAASGPTVSVFRPGGFSDRIRIAGIMEVLSEGIFYRLDSKSATPDSSDHVAPVGTIAEVEDVSRLRWIRSGASDAQVKMTYLMV